MVEIAPVVDEGLGNSSYLVGTGEGTAIVIDPSRDPRPYVGGAQARGWRLVAALETHLHADFVSGGRQLQARGARLLVPAGEDVAFDAEGLGDGDEVGFGELSLRALATPGHTPEHLSYLLSVDSSPVAVFTGGTLIVGGVARPDLLGDEHTRPLARAAYRSIRERLLALPDDVAVYPTHGAGSFCSSGSGDRRTTTIGRERHTNPLLGAGDEDEFAERLLGGLGSFPDYFLELRDVNRRGPRVYASWPPPLRRLPVDDVRRRVSEGAVVVDVRPVDAFAAGHIAGSLCIQLRDQFAVWLGWLVGRDKPLVFVVDDDQDRDQLVSQCLSVGYERLAGELAGGVAAWQAAGRPLGVTPLVDVDDLEEGRRILDVRQDSEWAAGHMPDAAHVELGALPARARDLPPGPMSVHCEHGQRSMTAASVLERAGRDDVQVLRHGPGDWARATGRDLQTGP